MARYRNTLHVLAKGVRDESLLQAALSRPVNHIAYASSHTIELAAGAIDENGFGEFLRADSKRNKWQATMPSAG